MAELSELIHELGELDAQHDLDGLKKTREKILENFADSEYAAEAAYKLGLDYLFRQRELQRAFEFFELAAERKHAYWSAAARTSLALCLYHQKKVQKALFELRKVAYVDPPTTHSATALGFMESILLTEGDEEEARRVRRERIKQLERLIEQAREADDGAERGYHLYHLGLALRDDGDGESARQVLEESKALGPDVLGAEIYRNVIEALG